MADNFNTSYLAGRREKQNADASSILSKWDQWDAQDAAPKAAPSPAPSAAPKTSSPSPVKEALVAAGGGVVDAVRNSWNAIDDAATWLDNNFLDLRIGSSSFGQMGGAKAVGSSHKEQLQVPALPDSWQNKTTGGQIARSVTQFVVPFLGATKALRYAAPAMGAVSRGAAAGAATDFTAFDPHEKRLSNLLVDMGDKVPALKNPVTEYLAASPADSGAEGRLKNTLEGLGIGTVAEGVFLGLKATKAHFTGKGVDPVEAVQAAHQEHLKDAEALAVDTSKAPDLTLQQQIEALTGVDRAAPGAAKWQKRLDVAAATKGDAKGVGSTDSPVYDPDWMKKAEGVPVQTTGRDLTAAEKNQQVINATPEMSTSDLLKKAEEDVSAKRAYRPLVDDHEGTIVFSKEDPKPGQLDLGDRVKTAMFKAPHERTAEDLVALRAYRQLQEGAFPGLIKPGDEVAQAEARSLVLGDSAGSGKAALSDEERAALKDTSTAPKATPEVPRADSDLEARIAKAQAKVDDLIAEGKAPGPHQDVLDNLLKKRDAALRDHTSALSTKQADSLADPLLAAIRSNQDAINKVAMRQQGGFISPAVLANMASAQVGGVVGWNSAEDDATVAEKLSLAGMGALAGLGVKVGASKVLTHAERAVVENASPEVRSLSRPEVANIAPVATEKKPPVITRAKVDKLVEAAKSGGMESLAKAAKEADFNFNHIDTQEDVKRTIDAFSTVFEKETSLAAHGTQTDAQLKELAGELGAGEKSLKELYQGTENLGARILAHRALLTASAEKVTGLSRMAMAGDSDAILALRKQVALHASIQAQMKGVQTEVARALSQFRITSSSIDLAINERNQLIDAMGGHAANIRFAQQLSEIVDPKQLNAVIRKGAVARTQDALYEAWVNGLLSSPPTHAANFIGNALVAVGSAAERGTASMIGKVLRTGAEAVDSGEVTAHLYGMMEGLTDALKITKHGLDAAKRAAGEALTGNFGDAERIVRENSSEFGGAWKAFAEDAPVLDNAAYGTKQMDLQQAAISSANFGLQQQSFMGRVADGLGAIIRTPGRLLTTSDELFKTIHYRGELKAQAYRKARSEGLEGDELFNRMANLIEDPTPEMRAQSLQAAREGTFTSPLGKTGAGLQSVIANTPGLKVILPFVRTPTNIAKYVGVRTPGLNLLSSNVRAELAAGGARRDMMLAKTALGSALYAVGGYLASQGYIVGGGEKDQSAEKMGGELPYSVKIGDTYYSFNRLDPVGMMLGLAADFSDISGHLGDTEADGLASAAVLSISRNLMSKSYLSGLVNALDAISQQDGKMDKFIQNMAGSVVPGIVNTARKMDDPTAKEVWSAMDAMKAKIPGWSKEVPPQVNLFGEDVMLKGGLGPDNASPIITTQESSDPAAREIARLNIDLRKPAKTLGGGNGAPGVDLTPQQYYRYMKLMGQGFKESMSELVKSDYYKNLPEDPTNNLYQDAKEKTIRVLYERQKRAAMGMLLMEDPELKSKFIQNLQNAGNALQGLPISPL